MPLPVKIKKTVLGTTFRLFSIGGFQEGMIKTHTLLMPTWYVVISVTIWDGSFGHSDKGIAEVLISLPKIFCDRCCPLCVFIGDEAVVFAISLAEVFISSPASLVVWPHLLQK